MTQTARYLFASIPVADRDKAQPWYQRLMGRPPDLLPNDDEAAWSVTETGWMYIVTDPARAGSAYHTMLIDDLDKFLAGLAERGVATAPVTANAAGVRRTEVHDPDGNRIQLAQAAEPA